MTQTVCILGRQPALGLAELESLYGADKIRPIGALAALIDIDPPEIDFSRLGGTVKFCKVLTILDTTSWPQIQKFLEKNVAPHAANMPEGKMKLGLSLYGLNVNVNHINASGLAVKKVVKATGRSIRVVPNKEHALNSAQVLHNQLTSALGWELVFIRDGEKTIVAQNIAEQDIEAYSRRDQGRPMRDARVGMLPPKLAQIILNLASGLVKESGDGSREMGEAKEPEACPAPNSQLLSPAGRPVVVLDPFFGTGVLLQEAMLMGYRAYGTDLEPRMIDYSRTNLEWLQVERQMSNVESKLQVGDATDFKWKPFDVVACETYLGRPFSTLPSSSDLDKTIQDCNVIHRKFLQNIATQAKSGTRLCLAVPAWKTPHGFKHLPTLDSLTDMGYTRVSLVHASGEDLIYHREGQIVARELVILQKK